MAGNVIGIVGAGTMGAGIAEVAVLAGERVLLFDGKPGAASATKARLSERFARRVSEGKLDADDARLADGHISPCGQLTDFRHANLIIEAISEDLGAKRDLLQTLERLVPDTVLLASNTSSLSITELGASLTQPPRFAGMHFFNPAPVMGLVELVSGLATSEETIAELEGYCKNWGKTSVRVRSSPGFIVNKGARPFYGEALRLLEEGVADAATIDALLKANGFRMGPLELIDLVGLDINLAVSRRMFEAYHCDHRYEPSLLVEEMVAGGMLGQKSGHGFYSYLEGASRGVTEEPPVTAPDNLCLKVCGDPGPATPLIHLWQNAGVPVEFDNHKTRHWFESRSVSLILSDGRVAADSRYFSGRDWALFDLSLDYENLERIGLALSPSCSKVAVEEAIWLFQTIGKKVHIVNDSPGMFVARTICTLINEAFDTLSRGVANKNDINEAMKKGLNFPGGPFDWFEKLTPDYIARVLDALEANTKQGRYRVDLRLRRLQWDFMGQMWDLEKLS